VSDRDWAEMVPGLPPDWGVFGAWSEGFGILDSTKKGPFPVEGRVGVGSFGEWMEGILLREAPLSCEGEGCGWVGSAGFRGRILEDGLDFRDRYRVHSELQMAG
jgi:hypothetical protein